MNHLSENVENKGRTLRVIMSVVMLSAVYVAANVCLQSGGENLGIIHAQDKESDDSINIDLSTKKVVIDSGHGGIDSGKEGCNGLLEKDINLAIAIKLRARLEEAGVKVIMTRSDDGGLYQESDSNKKIADMKKRCEIINTEKPDLAISIHQNSFPSPNVSGAQVFFYKHSSDGKKLACMVQQSLKDMLNPENNRVEKSDTTYYMLIHTDVPTIIAECGFLSNVAEADMLGSEEYQEKVAEALYNGIMTFLTNASN